MASIKITMKDGTVKNFPHEGRIVEHGAKLIK